LRKHPIFRLPDISHGKFKFLSYNEPKFLSLKRVLVQYVIYRLNVSDLVCHHTIQTGAR